MSYGLGYSVDFASLSLVSTGPLEESVRLPISKKILVLVLVFYAGSSFSDNRSLWQKVFNTSTFPVYCAAVIAGSAIGTWWYSPKPPINFPVNVTHFELSDLQPGPPSKFKLQGLAYPELAEYLLRLDPHEQLEILKTLPVAKTAWLFRDRMYQVTAAKQFGEIAERDAKRAAQILRVLDEGPFGFGGQGEMALALLKVANPQTQAAVLKELAVIDAEFAGVLVKASKGEKIKREPGDPGIVGDSQTIHKVADDRTVVEIAQNEYIFTDVEHHKKVQTYGIGPCIAVSLWDKVAKVGVIAHLDAGAYEHTGLSFDRIFADFEARELGVENLEVGLIGARQGLSEDLLWAILHRFKIQGISTRQIKHTSLFRGPTASMMLDLETGEVTQFDPTESPFSKHQVERQFMETFKTLGSPLRRSVYSLPSPFEK